MTIIFVKDSQLLSSVKSEWNSRGKAYLVKDRHLNWLLLTQRISQATTFINSEIATPIEKVNSTSLYDAVDSEKVHKLRWTVSSVGLDDAPAAFEAERLTGYDNVIILGHGPRYLLIESSGRALLALHRARSPKQNRRSFSST